MLTYQKTILLTLLFLLTIFAVGCGGATARPAPTNDGLFEFKPPDGLFSLKVPETWTESTVKSTDGKLMQFKFTAPDQRGFIHVVTATGDKPVSNQVAQAFMLRILQSYVDKDDKINILSDNETSKNQHTLIWHATKNFFGGKVMVDNRGNNLIVVGASGLDSASAAYRDLFDRVLASYQAH